MEEIIRQLIERMDGLELALYEMQKKEEKQRNNESSPCTPLKKEKRKKEEGHACIDAHTRGRKIFYIPTAEEVQNYLDKIGETRFDGTRFVDYYDSTGWMIGPDRPMRDWHAAARNWSYYQGLHPLHLKEHGGKPAPQPVATPQFHETEAYLQNIERERKQAVSYEEYKRQLAEGRLR